MNNNLKKLLITGFACAAVCTTALAAPRGGRSGPATRPAPAHYAPQAKGGHSPHGVHTAPNARTTAHGNHAQVRLAPPTQPMPPHRAAPRAPQLPHHGRPHVHHMPPPRPRNHRPCGRLYPHGHHIGGRHVVIVPPLVVIDSYYWTEEVLIDGVYYILYCYPDGTKRFADGTIFCYF